MLKIEITGLDEVRRTLERLKKVGEQADGTHKAPFMELFNRDFMHANSSVASFEALIEAGGFKVQSAEDFLAIPDADWEKCVRAQTRFGSWEEMQRTAGAEWLKRELGKVL